MNPITDRRTPEYTASRAYRIHIVASDHNMKDPHVHNTSIMIPVEEELKKSELWDGYGNILLKFCPIRSNEKLDWLVGPIGIKAERTFASGGRP